MKKLKRKAKVFFNASVILAGFHSPHGGSGTLLKLAGENKIIGIISEIVVDEVLRNIHKTPVGKKEAIQLLSKIFLTVKAPDKKFFSLYKNLVIDEEDVHLFVSAKKVRADFLVSLDKKHILILEKKIKDFKIVSPKELIEFLRFKLK